MKKALIALIPFLSACAGEPPQNIGVNNGRLTACPESPNCVSSFATDETHTIQPIAASLQQIEQIVRNTEAATIVTAQDNYLYAEYTSRIMGYVDDVEFLYDQNAAVTHVRSASRLGYSDMGANRKRIEAIRSALPGD